VDGAVKEMGDVQYLLSPQDLMAVEMVPELIEAGVGCFKIEGRLKGPEYVALTTSIYRRAVDEAWEQRQELQNTNTAVGGGDTTKEEVGEWRLSAKDRVDLTQVFARGQDEDHDGLTRGFLEGPKHQRLVRGRGPRHRGVLLGEVTHCFTREGGGVVVRLKGTASIKRGDGVVFDCGHPDEPEAGGRVYEVLDERGNSLAKNAEEAVTEVGLYTCVVLLQRCSATTDVAWKQYNLNPAYPHFESAWFRLQPLSLSSSEKNGFKPLLSQMQPCAAARRGSTS
jgi:putative protease